MGSRSTIEGCTADVLDIKEILALARGRINFALSLEAAKVEVNLSDERGQVSVHHHNPDSISATMALAQQIELVALPWAFGGKRWFMVCPIDRRLIVKAYRPLGARIFASRQALGLAYRSTRMNSVDRSHAKLARAYAKLGGSYRSLSDKVPARPRRMHQIKYRRLLENIVREKARHLGGAHFGSVDRLKSSLLAISQKPGRPALRR